MKFNSKRLGVLLISAMMMGVSVIGLYGCSKNGDGGAGKDAPISGENAAVESGEIKAETRPSSLKLGEYKDIHVTVEKIPDVTEADVINAIESILANATVTNENTSRAVAEGDTVNVNYAGYMDGQEIQDSAVADYNILIGSGVFFDGAEKELIGVLPGETKEISVVFPEGYPQAELSGKSAVYKVTVNYIDETQQAALTDEFVASISDSQTVDAFRQEVKDTLTESRENERRLAKETAVWSQVLANTDDVVFNSDQVEAIVDAYKAYDEAAAKDFEMSLEDYVVQYQQMDYDTYMSQLEKLAQDEIREELTVEAIAKAENIHGDKATEAEIERCARELGYETVDAYKNSRSDEEKNYDVKRIRVMDFVMSCAQITEVNE